MSDTDSKQTQAERAIERYAAAALVPGLVPVPWVDLAALAALQLALLRSLAGIYGVEFSSQLGKSAVGALLGGGVPVSLSASLGSLAKGVPGIGWAIGGLGTALFGAASTYALGRVFVQHFESGNTLLTFDPERVRAYYAQELEKGKEDVRKSFAGLKP